MNSKVLSYSRLDTRKDNTHNKIELVNCQSGGKNCKSHLTLINQHYTKAHDFLAEKDYRNSIKALKDAFYIATELRETSCLSCAAFFQSTLTESMEKINNELHKMISGIFKKNRYKVVYIESCNVLEEFKNNIQNE